MSTKWGSIASGLATGMEMGRRRKQEDEDRKRADEDRAARQRQQDIQMDTAELALQGQGVLNPNQAQNRAETSDEGNNMTKLPSGRFFDPSLKPKAPPKIQVTDDGIFTIDPVTQEWKPVIVGGKQVGAKPQLPEYDSRRGALVNRATGVATTVAGLPAEPADPKGPVPGSQEWFDMQLKVLRMRNDNRPPSKPDGMSESNKLALRGQFNGEQILKDGAQVATALRKVRSAAQDPSPAGDLALLIGYMKLLDPGSVVREQEFATAAKAGSLPQQIQAAATRVVNGQRLTPEQRADFVARAEQTTRSYREQFRSILDRYTADAKAAGMDPSRVVYDPYAGLFDAKPAGTAPPMGGDTAANPFASLIPKKKP